MNLRAQNFYEPESLRPPQSYNHKTDQNKWT